MTHRTVRAAIATALSIVMQQPAAPCLLAIKSRLRD